MKVSLLLLNLFYVIILFPLISQQYDVDHYLDPFDSHPRLIIKNGHLVLLSGRNKDLVFRSSGSGQIKINGNDLLPSKIQLPTSLNDQDQRSLTEKSMTNHLLLEQTKINTRIDELNQRLNESLVVQKKLVSLKQFRRLRTLAKRLERLEKLLKKNECASNPCQNGATCEDGFNKYFCRCPTGFKGGNCEQDVDECSLYQGTELGCQNGGTCLNTFGSFHCLCPPNHQGVRCNIEFNDCRNVSDHEICGQGLCLNMPRTQSNVARFRCVCFQGFTKSNPSSDSAPCDIDVNECALGLDHCSKDPPVPCINTPDGYRCGPCPQGYTGDGIRCSIMDRCSVNNGGCSMQPRVSCFSDQGRVICGPCPPGYVGDGFTCSTVDGDICSTNNGGCSPNARCVANTAISATFRQCICNDGFTGDGTGTQGCQPISTISCANNPCLNGGTCLSYSNGGQIFCQCVNGFTGRFCQNERNLCQPNPCQNDGQCVRATGGYSCICTKEFTGQNCEHLREACGGEIDAESGVVSFPPSNGSSFYANNVTCIWKITNNNQAMKVLNITFTKFKIEKSPGCAFDYLEMFDGPNREYRKLGKFCGEELPINMQNFMTSFNSLYIHFRSDPSISHEGFEVRWSTVDPACGGMIVNRSHGIVESPGYPYHYPANRDCYWEIIGDFGKRLQFLFSDLDIEPSQNCTFDYLTIQEGLSLSNLYNNANQIARFCNWTATPEQTVPPPITTTSSFARIHFHSDAGIHSRGFHLAFNQVPGVCGGILTGSAGIFQSPSTSYTSKSTGRTYLVYENNIVCDWLIRVMPNERISLRFLSFALESDSMVSPRPRNQSGVCMFDYVEVYDGDSFGAPLRARLCGRIIPPEIISTGRFLRIKFRSDMSVSLRGFIAQYQALCGGEYTDPEGRFESPNYPALSLLSKNCTYLITAPLDHIIQLTIEEMDIESDHKCLFDYIMVQGQRFCGQLPPLPFYSTNNELKIFYVNDETRPSRGFRARYKVMESGCGGVLKQGDPRIAISAERLVDFPMINQCLWEIRANQSFVVMVKFFHPETPSNVHTATPHPPMIWPYSCVDHYIMINDTDGSLIKKFCVSELPPPITSTGNIIFITYVFNVPDNVNEGFSIFDANYNITTNSSNTTTTTPTTTVMYSTIASNRRPIRPMPFYATYHFLSTHQFCDKNLFKNTGIIRSPRFPRRYPNNQNCTWIIHVDNGLQIHMKFNEFKMEPPSEINGRCYDYLEIRNGRRSDSPLIGQFCGFGPMPDIVSHSNYLFLRFISDPSMQNKGFEINYEALATGCGGLLTAESGSIESPGFPDHYPSNMNCEWKIRVAEGSIIMAYIIQLDIERSNTLTSTCGFDYLELFDGDSYGNRQSLGKFCNQIGSNSPVILSSGNQMFLKFVTDATVNHGGFKINYRTECNRTLTGRYGIIESPNYPNPHPHNLNCNWHILGPLGNNISVSFTQLNLEHNIDCKFDYVNVTTVIRPQPYSMAMINNLKMNEPYVTKSLSYCGNYTGTSPPKVVTESNEVIITFMSDETRSFESGFRLEWSAKGCGGEIRNRPFGVITSPNYPNPYPLNVECLWHIRAEQGHRVDLLIEELDLEFSHGCTFDYLQVFSGLTEDSPTITKLCNRNANILLSSFGDSMTIKLVSDMSTIRKGFNATFRTVDSGCYGTYYVEKGTITSPNFGARNQYDPKTDCTYKLLAEENFDIEITVNEYQIPESTNCTQSYLAIYDSDSDEDENKLLAKYCGQYIASPPTNQIKLRSNDSVLFVRLKSDGINSGRGFNITYRKVCGKTIIIDDQMEFREITSANYPHPYQDESDCKFLLKASKPDNRLTIRFTSFETMNIQLQSPTQLCDFVSVTIYEGDEELPHKLRQNMCSHSIPVPVVSEGDTLLLISKNAVFRALVSSIQSSCGGDFHSVEGYITNPGYPLSYPLNIECIWILEAAPGNRFHLEFEAFDIELSDYCNNDYLEIRLDNSSGLIIGDQRLCGKADNIQKPMPQLQIDLPGNIWIKFRTDDIGVASGFLLHFRIAHTVMLSAPTGMIGSPGWPDGYFFENATYLWYIVVPHHNYIKINFEEFTLSQISDMCPIHLAIFNGLVDFTQMAPSIDMSSSTNNNPILTSFQTSLIPQPKLTLCGQNLPKEFVADSNAVTLMYHNNYLMYMPYSRIRFLLKWSMINSTDYTLVKQSIGTPADANSTFNIFLDHGQKFELLADNFSAYGNDINWYFRTKPSMHLNITVNKLNFDPIVSCWSNKMTIDVWNTLNNRWKNIKTICQGQSDIGDIQSTEFRIHLLHLKIHDGIPVSVNYNLTIFPVCGGNFTDLPNGQIDSSEDIDKHVRGEKVCQWRIKVRQGRTIRFHVDYYSIGTLLDASRCPNRNESLNIHNGHSADSPLLTRPICGLNNTWTTLPETSTNYAYIIYKSKRPNNYFRIRFEEVGVECGGELIIQKPTDSIILTSPGYPESPKHDVTCEWIIRGPLDYGLQVTFKQESWTMCNEENSYIEIFDGGSELSGRIEKICIPTYNSNSISINSHTSLIRYVLKKANFQSKFSATISVDSCNREYYVPYSLKLDGQASLIDNDQYRFPLLLSSSPPRSFASFPSPSCTIKLRTQSNFFIMLNITSVNLQGTDCSSGDVIEFQDNSLMMNVFKRICPPKNDSQTSILVNSSSNELYINYKRTNLELNRETNLKTFDTIGIKFYAVARNKRCYHLIDVKNHPTGMVVSPDYPKASSRRVSCSWLFYNEPGTRIRLFFNWFDLGDLPPDELVAKEKTVGCNKIMLISKNIFIPRNLVERYGCSKKKPKVVLSFTNVMSIRMYANELGVNEGFSLVYASVKDNESCSDIWDQPHGYFQTYSFDDPTKTGQIGCAWEMKLSYNQSGSLLLDTFDVPFDCTHSTFATGQFQMATKTFSPRNVICVPSEHIPQNTKKKFIVPIYRDVDESKASNPSIFLNFPRPPASSYKGMRGEYFIHNCGGSFPAEREQEFTSPNYPNAYPDPLFCHWLIRRINTETNPDGSNDDVRLTFLELDIGPDCDTDYFMLKLNPRFESHGSEKICYSDFQNNRLKPIYLTSYALLTFVSSRNLSTELSPNNNNVGVGGGGGKKFKFKIEPISHGCGGTLISKEGYIQSPNYVDENKEGQSSFNQKTTDEYPNSIECIWIIKAMTDFHLSFRFETRFDLEQSDNCQNDFLLFEEWNGETWINSKKLCGHKTPENFESQSFMVRVTFRSNEKIQGDGFKLKYSQKCGGTFQEESGIIHSPNYFSQGIYSNELTCVYRIQRKPNEYVRVEFEDFDLEEHAKCLFDSVVIYQGDHLNKSSERHGPYCGTLPPPVLTSHELITVVFHTDNFITKRGFKFRYEISKCGGNLTDPEGFIISPPESRHECVWHITVPDERMSVALQILEMDLGNDNCRYDCCNSLKIQEDLNEGLNPPLAYLCTNITADVTYKSSSNHIIVYFRHGFLSVNKNNHGRFKIHYWSSPGPASNCGGIFQDQNDGAIFSPDLDGDSYYEPHLDCIWIINAGSQQVVSLEFERFDTASGANISQEMTIKEHPDPDACLHGGDYVQLFDGFSLHSPQLALLCGRIVPEKFITTGNSMLIQFKSNLDGRNGHGFRAHFKLENRTCGFSMISNEDSSTLTSPGYPNGYDSPQQCAWEIMFGSMYYRMPLVLKIWDLDLNCAQGDYLQFIQHRSFEYDTYAFSPITLCQSDGKAMKIITSVHNRARLIFKTFSTATQTNYDGNKGITNGTISAVANQHRFRGFNLTHHVALCNETLDGPDNGFIINRNFPHQTYVRNYFLCIINISVAEDRQLSLYFDQFSFYLCSHSNMTIYDGSGGRALATYCDQRTSPNPVFSTSNRLMVKIQANFLQRVPGSPINPHSFNNMLIYSLTYTSVPKSMAPGCGGNFTSLRGTFTSPNYPQSIQLDTMCQWMIKTNSYHTITLTFEAFSLSTTCESRVLVYDGTESLEEKLLGTFCSNEIPAPIHSLSSSMLIQFYVTLNNFEPGFKASYKVNTQEPTIKGRVVTKNTFKFYREYRVFTDV